MTLTEIQSHYKRMDPMMDRMQILADLTGRKKINISELLGIPIKHRATPSAARPLNEEHALTRYEAGDNDITIAAACNCLPCRVRDWRRREGLALNIKPPTKWLDGRADVRRLYDMGCSDKYISQRLGESIHHVISWRANNGLPMRNTNGGDQHKWAKLTAKWDRILEGVGV